jgi:hypothetical protein
MGETLRFTEEPAFEHNLLRKVEMAEVCRRKRWDQDPLQSHIG